MISLTERQMQVAGLLAIARENLSIDLHTLSCVGRKAGKNDATCLRRFSKRVEAYGDICKKFRDHFAREIGAAVSGACKLLTALFLRWSFIV